MRKNDAFKSVPAAARQLQGIRNNRSLATIARVPTASSRQTARASKRCAPCTADGSKLQNRNNEINSFTTNAQIAHPTKQAPQSNPNRPVGSPKKPKESSFVRNRSATHELHDPIRATPRSHPPVRLTAIAKTEQRKRLCRSKREKSKQPNMQGNSPIRKK